MANIRTGSIVSDLRGKVGTEVYSRNRGGAYVKTFVPPTNPGSNRQTAYRTYFASAVSSWENLSETNRLRWDQYAASVVKPNSLGVIRRLTGRQVFISRYTTCRVFDDSEPSYPEPPNDLDNLSRSVSITSTPAINWTVSFPHPNYDWGIIWYMSVPVTATVRSFNSTRVSRISVLYYGTTPSINFYSSYSSLWGALSFTSGEYIWVKTVSVHIPSGFRYGELIDRIQIS